MTGLIFINTHPIQYFAPLYKNIAESKQFNLQVIYFSDESLKKMNDIGFNKSISWDIPLLEGYKSVFIKNRSFKPSIFNGFWGLINPGILRYLRKSEKSIVVIHGWGYFSSVLSIIFSKLCGHTVCLRAESPWNQELLKNKYLTKLKHTYLKFLFRFVDYFLYIGEQNKQFYQHLGIPETQTIFVPYCVDNKRFKHESLHEKAYYKKELGLNPEKKVILFSGKYIEKKRPVDLLNAFLELDEAHILVMVGEGNLRPEMESFIELHQLQDRVKLTGFVNQTEIGKYYSAADVFVLCSGLGETWGLVVNEAMNFSLPVICSDIPGSAYDLVKEGINGYIFKTGNTEQLAEKLIKVLEDPAHTKKMGENSLKIIQQYDFNVIIKSLLEIKNQFRN